MWIRFVIYGLLGVTASVVWTAIEDRIRGDAVDWRLRGSTSLWTFPLFGLVAVLYEPLHDGLRSLPWFMRGATYAIGFWLVEYVTGWLLRRVLGACPWSYDKWKGNLHGLITWEFGAVWFATGLLLEPLHDRLTLLSPVMERALFR